MSLLPRRLLHIEGLAVLVGSLGLYVDAGVGWLLLLVLFLAPDISMIPARVEGSHLQRA